MTSTLTSHPVGQRGTVANRKGTVVGTTTVMSEGLGHIEPVPFTLLVVRLDTDQGGYLTQPHAEVGYSSSNLSSKDTRWATYISTMLVAPDCWAPEEQA